MRPSRWLIPCLLLVTALAQAFTSEHLLDKTKKHCTIVYAKGNDVIDGVSPHLSEMDFVPLDVAALHSLIHAPHPYVTLKLVNASSMRAITKYTSIGVNRRTWLIAPLRPVDRTCLMSPPLSHASVKVRISEEEDGKEILALMNGACNTFYAADGRINSEGERRQLLLDGRYGLRESTEGQEGGQPQLECDSVDDVPSVDHFMRHYLFASRPLVIKSAVKNRWAALHKWTNDWLRGQFGDRQVHVKLTPPVGVFEGVEPMAWWEDSTSPSSIPSEVRAQLVQDEVVVVRPAGVQMSFDQLIDLIEKKVANASLFSAYLEYTSIDDFLKVLRADATPLPFMSAHLTEEHRNVWLSDGNTLGKLHFDEFDNLLVMVDGRKTVRLYAPWDNRRLREGHIVEAQLQYDNGSFTRGTLMQSTAMTMSPIDILRHDVFENYPDFLLSPTTECTIDTGDALYLPAFWWHEVQSSPSPLTQRNLAVNFWYTPFFTKAFPCADCVFDVNPLYRHLLES